MKISVFTVITPEYTPEEIVGKLARMGFEGVEWRVVAVLKGKESFFLETYLGSAKGRSC